MKSDVSLRGGGTIKITPHGAHTGDKTYCNVAGLLERVLVRNRTNDDKQPRFMIEWSLGHHDADIITLMQDGSGRYNGSWKYSPAHNSTEKDIELKGAMSKLWNAKT